MVEQGGQGGARPQDFGRFVNPTHPGRGQILPTTLLLVLRIFRASYGPGMCLIEN